MVLHKQAIGVVRRLKAARICKREDQVEADPALMPHGSGVIWEPDCFGLIVASVGYEVGLAPEVGLRMYVRT